MHINMLAASVGWTIGLATWLAALSGAVSQAGILGGALILILSTLAYDPIRKHADLLTRLSIAAYAGAGIVVASFAFGVEMPVVMALPFGVLGLIILSYTSPPLVFVLARRR